MENVGKTIREAELIVKSDQAEKETKEQKIAELE